MRSFYSVCKAKWILQMINLTLDLTIVRIGLIRTDDTFEIYVSIYRHTHRCLCFDSDADWPGIFARPDFFRQNWPTKNRIESTVRFENHCDVIVISLSFLLHIAPPMTHHHIHDHNPSSLPNLVVRRFLPMNFIEKWNHGRAKRWENIFWEWKRFLIDRESFHRAPSQ